MPHRASLKAERELVTALHEGIFEEPLWATFLDRLRRLTKADYATLVFQSPDMAVEDGLHLLSGGAAPTAIRAFYREHYPTSAPELPDLPENKPHSFADLAAIGASDFGRLRDIVEAQGITAIRNMRVRETTGVDAWVTIARSGKDFTAPDTALLRDIAPALRGVLRIYIAMERERFAASLTADAVRRLQFGWLALDRAGKILDCDAEGARLLASSGVLSRSASGRLTARPAKVEREIFSALRLIADNPKGRTRAITLSSDPWLDMLLAPARRTSISVKGTPVAIAYVHGDSWRSADRCDQLAELFALSPSEARLALALARGMTIAEAASAFSITVETARSYSKSIYAKTGARGLPDLVRIVMRSVLAIAPDE